MRLIVEIKVKLKSERLPDLMKRLSQMGCQVQRMSLTELAADEYIYQIELSASSQTGLKEFTASLKSEENAWSILDVHNSLEEKITGGLLNVSCRMPFETMGDYQIGILGALDLIGEKIDLGIGSSFSGIARGVGMISGVRSNRELISDVMLRVHAGLERDSAVLNRFTGLNAYPLMLSYLQPEDFIKHLQSLQGNFSLIRLHDVDESDMMFFEQIYNTIGIPLVSRALDEMPLYILSLMSKIVKKNKLSPRETAVGLIGLDVGNVRITHLLKKMGFHTVLGYDVNEKLMLALENSGGLATTAENIFGNADIIFITKRIFESKEYGLLRPGQFLVSLVPMEAGETDLAIERGVREYHVRDREDLTLLFPGIAKGMASSGLPVIDDSLMLKLTGLLTGLLDDRYCFPDLFSDIHEKIGSIVSTL